MSAVGIGRNGKRVLDSLALSIGLVATAALMDPAPALAQERDAVGRNEVSPKRYAGLYAIRSAYNVPGTLKMRGFNHPKTCNDSRLRVRIGQDIENPEAATDEVCQFASQALEYLGQALGGTPLRIALDLDVVPPGTAAHWEGRLWGFSPKLRLGVPMLRSKKSTIHNLVDLVAHEGFHAIGFARGDASWSDEEAAYYHGLCAQLIVLGELPRETLPIHSKLEAADDAIGASLRASSKVRDEVYPLFRERDALPATEGGQILSRCLGPEALPIAESVSAKP